MRKRAKDCPLCGVRMTDKPKLPHSKELDHILPLNQGGTHTHGNVRIICRMCNARRPKDGSDFAGQLTLWAQAPGAVSRTRHRVGNSGNGGTSNKDTCRKGLHPWVPENIKIDSSGRRCCAPCYTAARREEGRKLRPQQTCQCGALYSARGTATICADCADANARKAVDLRAAGLAWAEVAAQTGYASAGGAYEAARKAGYRGERAGYRAPKPMRPGTAEKARRAAGMRKEGMTLRAIADELGYRSVSSVARLISIADADMQTTSPDDVTHCDACAA